MAERLNDEESIEKEKNDDSESSEDEEITIEPLVDKSLVEMADPFLDELIVRLMNAPLKQDKPPKVSKSRRIKSAHKGHHLAHVAAVNLEVSELEKLLEMAQKSFAQQSSLLRIAADRLPLLICGDIHGQFRSLREIFRSCGSPFQRSYLFLGDYVDRGVQGLEVMTLLLALKVKLPNKVFLLRGNHECCDTCESYGFYDELASRFNEMTGEAMYDTGYRFMCNGRLLTIFSAANYGNCRNSAAVMKVAMNREGQMNCRFTVFRVKRNGSADSK